MYPADYAFFIMQAKERAAEAARIAHDEAVKETIQHFIEDDDFAEMVWRKFTNKIPAYLFQVSADAENCLKTKRDLIHLNITLERTEWQ